MNILKEGFQKNSLDDDKKGRSSFWNIVLIILYVYLFLLSIDLMGEAFKQLGSDVARNIILATSDPFVSLFIGLLLTAVIQSSSTSTAMIVAVVASGSMDFKDAVPMVMGANIGTTLTSTIVSLGYITKSKEFRKAISAGTIHDIFNILVVILLFPLELYYGFLSNLAQYITNLITPDSLSQGTSLNFNLYITKPATYAIARLVSNTLVLVLLSFALLFFSIKFLSTEIYRRLIGNSKDQLRKYIFKSSYKSFFVGALLTAGVQSSSITTSLVVPLVATGKVSLKRSFPFIMGANLGTTITALLAAFFKSDAAISIAIAHLLFNMLGVLIFMPIPFIRSIPVILAGRFGRLTMHHRIIGFAYIIVIFFLLPFTLIYISRNL